MKVAQSLMPAVSAKVALLLPRGKEWTGWSTPSSSCFDAEHRWPALTASGELRVGSSVLVDICFFPDIIVFCRRRTGQSPGFGEALGAGRVAKSKPELFGGWEAAGVGMKGCLGEHFAERRFVSFHIDMVGAILGQGAPRTRDARITMIEQSSRF